MSEPTTTLERWPEMDKPNVKAWKMANGGALWSNNPPIEDHKPTPGTTKRLKWVQAESREEHECERLGWKVVAQETRMDNSLWCLWANMEGTDD